jgi:hypothetical protein
MNRISGAWRASISKRRVTTFWMRWTVRLGGEICAAHTCDLDMRVSDVNHAGHEWRLADCPPPRWFAEGRGELSKRMRRRCTQRWRPRFSSTTSSLGHGWGSVDSPFASPRGKVGSGHKETEVLGSFPVTLCALALKSYS